MIVYLSLPKAVCCVRGTAWQRLAVNEGLEDAGMHLGQVPCLQSRRPCFRAWRHPPPCHPPGHIPAPVQGPRDLPVAGCSELPRTKHGSPALSSACRTHREHTGRWSLGELAELCHSLAVWPWASHFLSQGLSPLICKMGPIPLTSQGCSED